MWVAETGRTGSACSSYVCASNSPTPSCHATPRHTRTPSQDPIHPPTQPSSKRISFLFRTHIHTRGALGGVDVHRVVQKVGDARLERSRQRERRDWRQQQQGGGGCMYVYVDRMWLDFSVGCGWGRPVGQLRPPEDRRRASIYVASLSLLPRPPPRWLTSRREPVRRQALPLLLLEGAGRDECLRHGRGQQERPYYPLHHPCLLCVWVGLVERSSKLLHLGCVSSFNPASRVSIIIRHRPLPPFLYSRSI